MFDAHYGGVVIIGLRGKGFIIKEF